MWKLQKPIHVHEKRAQFARERQADCLASKTNIFLQDSLLRLMVVAHMATGQAAVDSDPVAKCAKFFKTLINLTQQNQEKYTPNAVELVKSLIEVCSLFPEFTFLFSCLECHWRHNSAERVHNTYTRCLKVSNSTTFIAIHWKDPACAKNSSSKWAANNWRNQIYRTSSNRIPQ